MVPNSPNFASAKFNEMNPIPFRPDEELIAFGRELRIHYTLVEFGASGTLHYPERSGRVLSPATADIQENAGHWIVVDNFPDLLGELNLIGA